MAQDLVDADYGSMFVDTLTTNNLEAEDYLKTDKITSLNTSTGSITIEENLGITGTLTVDTITTLHDTYILGGITLSNSEGNPAGYITTSNEADGNNKMVYQSTRGGGGHIFHTNDGTGTTETMRLTNTGRLGLGTTEPGYTLDISGDLNITGAYKLSGVDIFSGNTMGSGIVNSSLTSVGTLNSLSVSGDLIVDSGTLGVYELENRVGINNVTPQYDLDVDGEINSSTGYLIGGTSVFTTTTLGSSIVNSSLTSVGTLTSLDVSGGATLSGGATVADGLTVSGDLLVDTNTLYVDSATGRVGMGTTGPTTGLDVQNGDLRVGTDTFQVSTSSSTTTIANLQVQTAASFEGGGVTFANASGSSGLDIISDTNQNCYIDFKDDGAVNYNGRIIYDNSVGDMKFYTETDLNMVLNYASQNEMYGPLVFYTDNTGSGSTRTNAGYISTSGNGTSTNEMIVCSSRGGGALKMQTNNGSGVGDRMIISNVGRVSIGATAPATPNSTLHINNSLSTNTTLTFGDSGSTAASMTIAGRNTGDSAYTDRYKINSNSSSTGNAHTWYDSSGNSEMTLDNSGNLATNGYVSAATGITTSGYISATSGITTDGYVSAASGSVVKMHYHRVTNAYSENPTAYTATHSYTFQKTAAANIVIIEAVFPYLINGWGTDSYFARLRSVDNTATSVYSDEYVQVFEGNSGGGSRSSALSPIKWYLDNGGNIEFLVELQIKTSGGDDISLSYCEFYATEITP